MKAITALLCAAGVAMAPTAQADTVLWVSGTRGPSWILPPGSNAGGQPVSAFWGVTPTDTIDVVPYPAALWPVTALTDPTLGQSVGTGVTSLTDAVHTTGGPLIIAGVSQGAIVIDQTQAALNDDLTVPSSTVFVVAGDPLRPGGLLDWVPRGVHIPILDYTTPGPLPENRFQTVVIINEYDGIADRPTHPLNLLANLNALMGAYYSHPQEGFLPTDAAIVTTSTNSQGGTITTYLVPSMYLPLTMPLRQFGVPAPIVDAADSVLRPIVDAGYDRPVSVLAPVAPSAPAPSLASVPSSAPDPVVAPEVAQKKMSVVTDRDADRPDSPGADRVVREGPLQSPDPGTLDPVGAQRSVREGATQSPDLGTPDPVGGPDPEGAGGGTAGASSQSSPQGAEAGSGDDGANEE